MQKYIIIGCGRSGTTVTHLALRGHPNVNALNDEVRIRALFNEGISCFTYGNNTEYENKHSLSYLFDALTSMSEKEEVKVRGIKCATYSPFDAGLFVEKVQNELSDVSIIYTRRNDFVAQYASKILAAKTGAHHSWQSKRVYDHIKIKISSIKYVNYLLNCLEVEDQILRLKKTNPFLEFSFEEDIKTGNFRKLFQFLDLENMSPTWLNSKKVSPFPEDYITNYDKISVLTEKITYAFLNETNKLRLLKKQQYYYEKIKKLKNKLMRYKF